MPVLLDNNNYKDTLHNCYIDYYEGYRSKMVDFHAHDFYELSLILAGDLKIFVGDRVQEGADCRLVLAAPKVPHLISRPNESFYRRINLLFSNEFMADYVPEWSQLATVFGDHGRVIPLSKEDADALFERICDIEKEHDPFRRRLLTLCLLSVILERHAQGENAGTFVPHYVSCALTYIGEHYAEKLVASELAWRLGVGRTTLMTAFRQYTGSTLGEYILRCRVKAAAKRLREGESEQAVAVACGFSDACSLIRAFKKYYGLTPKKFLA